MDKLTATRILNEYKRVQRSAWKDIKLSLQAKKLIKQAKLTNENR